MYSVKCYKMMMPSCFTGITPKTKHKPDHNITSLKDKHQLQKMIENLKNEDLILKPYNIEYEKRTYTSAKFFEVSTGLEHASNGELLKARKRWYAVKQQICTLINELDKYP